MNANQRMALQESIEHWRDNVEREARGEEILTGWRHCACCRSTLNDDGDVDCQECPICQYTEQFDCCGTPYYAIVDEGASAKLMLDWLIELENNGTPEILEDDE